MRFRVYGCPRNKTVRALIRFKADNILSVFFIREPDDREALALATRICCHPSVSIILIKVDPIREEDEEQNEKVVENEPNQFVDTFRSIDNIYDLVIMEKRQDVGLRFEQDMKPWVEFEELGISGDMFASSDSENMKYVLMIQSARSVNGDFLGVARDKS
ncbi:hypothetical protein WN944_018085 [Citrus x changshan-huyou]|uniref:Uncharacterized protein n=1 Tax=Citrus x changshan-huyou TaxID=2935761 RepID=A0AAP0LSQ6_9ROSI